MDSYEFIDTPIATATKLDLDDDRKSVGQKLYRGMIGSLLYLTTSRKSTSGIAHFLGSCLVSWGTKKQNSMALSTAEAEYVAATSYCAQLL
ncbi:uncharacterized mitochondrial protein AtMg00810-like [Nicotiana tomentosiformis]|uniref:uncharacterized mitochondrial protein AtMg00810-like n=1 Tax=Nicotiana tomentosiformis TaxID=4098 RepID=UPI00388C5CF9